VIVLPGCPPWVVSSQYVVKIINEYRMLANYDDALSLSMRWILAFTLAENS
jgi:hypothetical protein